MQGKPLFARRHVPYANTIDHATRNYGFVVRTDRQVQNRLPVPRTREQTLSRFDIPNFDATLPLVSLFVAAPRC